MWGGIFDAGQEDVVVESNLLAPVPILVNPFGPHVLKQNKVVILYLIDFNAIF